MPYKVFYTDVKLPPEMKQPDFSKLIPLVFDSLDVALKKAFWLIENKVIVWKIEGNEIQMSRKVVENEYELKTGKHIRT